MLGKDILNPSEDKQQGFWNMGLIQIKGNKVTRSLLTTKTDNLLNQQLICKEQAD